MSQSYLIFNVTRASVFLIITLAYVYICFRTTPLIPMRFFSVSFIIFETKCESILFLCHFVQATLSFSPGPFPLYFLTQLVSWFSIQYSLVFFIIVICASWIRPRLIHSRFYFKPSNGIQQCENEQVHSKLYKCFLTNLKISQFLSSYQCQKRITRRDKVQWQLKGGGGR